MPEVPAPLSHSESEEHSAPYHELKTESLGVRLRRELQQIGSPVEVTGFEDSNGSPFWVNVTLGNRHSQISIAKLERLFIGDLWQDGVSLGNVKISSIEQLVEYLRAGVGEKKTIAELSKEFEFFSPSEQAAAFESGTQTYVAWGWKQYLGGPHDQYHERLLPFIRSAAEHAVLGKLWPYMSLGRFCFSRCIGYPFSFDCPFVQSRTEGEYEVWRAEDLYVDKLGTPVGTGNVEEALAFIEAFLPPDCGPAVHGTDEQLKTQT